MHYINPGGDYIGLEKVDLIQCPDCNRGNMVRSKKHSSMLLCPECGLKVDESELQRESKYLPDFGQTGKPFDTQTSANRDHITPSDYGQQAFVMGDTEAQDLEGTTLRGMAKAMNQGIDIKGKASPKDVEAIKSVIEPLLKDGKDVKVHLK